VRGGRADEAGEQRVRPVGARLEFGVELAADEPRVVRELDHLDERPVGRQPAEAEPVTLERRAEAVGDLVPVPVALADLVGAVRLRARVPGVRRHGYAPSRIVPPMSVTCCCDSMSETTAFAHSGANSLECESLMPHTFRANSMMAVCMPRQMPKNGSPVSRAVRIASTIPSTPRTPKPPGTRRPSYPARISRRARPT
jgi:hypothetical protein